MTTSRPSTASRGSAASEPLFVGFSGADVVCVTADEDLAGALRAALPGMSVLAVATPEALADLLLAGSCRVLAMDLAELGGAAVTVIHHLAGQFPDVPIIGIGTRHEEPLVAGLISAGEIHRFLHRPISTGRARTFFDSALRRHAELRAPAPTPARTPPAPTIRPLAATYASARMPPSTASPRAQDLAEPWYGSITLVVIGATVTVLAFGFMLLVHSSGPASAPAVVPASTGVPAPVADSAVTHPIVRGSLRPTQPRPAPAPPPRATLPVAVAKIAPAEPTVSPSPAAAARPAARAPAAAPAATPAAVAATTPATDTSAATAAPVLVKLAGGRAEFPAAARDAGLTEGWVDVHFTVSTDGEPGDLSVTGAEPKGVFDDAALEAVRHWRYQPTATPSAVDQRIRFKLAPAAAP